MTTLIRIELQEESYKGQWTARDNAQSAYDTNTVRNRQQLCWDHYT